MATYKGIKTILKEFYTLLKTKGLCFKSVLSNINMGVWFTPTIDTENKLISITAGMTGPNIGMKLGFYNKDAQTFTWTGTGTTDYVYMQLDSLTKKPVRYEGTVWEGGTSGTEYSFTLTAKTQYNAFYDGTYWNIFKAASWEAYTARQSTYVSNGVYTNNTQTISGAKTFTGGAVFSGNGPQIPTSQPSNYATNGVIWIS